MHADFSVELGKDDPALEFPWRSDDPKVRYYDLKSHPELIQQIPEAAALPPLSAFLTRMNAAGFPLSTAKCDAWESREVAPEEEIYGDRKFVSYVDLVFDDEVARTSLEKHEAFARELCGLLARAPQIAATLEMVIRRSYFHESGANATAEGGVDRATPDEGDRSAAERGKEGVRGAERTSQVERDGGWVSGVDETLQSEKQVGEAEGALGWEEAMMERLGDDARKSRTSERVSIGKNELWVGEPGSCMRRAEGRLVEGPAEEVSQEHDGKPCGPDVSTSGFCLTAYVSGFGHDEDEPRGRWEVALTLVQNALVQLAGRKDSS